MIVLLVHYKMIVTTWEETEEQMFSQAVTDTEMSPVIPVNVSSEVRCGPPQSSVWVIELQSMKPRWLNYFLVLISFNVSLHIFYLYLLLGAHDSMDGTASSLYSFEQVMLWS